MIELDNLIELLQKIRNDLGQNCAVHVSQRRNGEDWRPADRVRIQRRETITYTKNEGPWDIDSLAVVIEGE